MHTGPRNQLSPNWFEKIWPIADEGLKLGAQAFVVEGEEVEENEAQDGLRIVGGAGLVGGIPKPFLDAAIVGCHTSPRDRWFMRKIKPAKPGL